MIISVAFRRKEKALWPAGEAVVCGFCRDDPADRAVNAARFTKVRT